MTNMEDNPETTELAVANTALEQAVAEALAKPVPEQEAKAKPYLFQDYYRLFGQTLKRQFKQGKKEVKLLPKKDAAGNVVELHKPRELTDKKGNVYTIGVPIQVRDYSDVQFWHEGKLISKAEHDELTNGVQTK